MIKTIRKIGNSKGVTIDQAILEAIGLKEGSKVNVILTGGSISITPVEGVIPQDVFEDAVDWAFKNYGKVLDDLA